MHARGGEAAAHVVGRERELAVLDEFVRADQSQGAVVLVGGPGFGKTTLWRAAVAAAREAQHGVLTVRPSDSEAQLAFAALTDLLDEVDGEALADLPPPQLCALEIALLRAEPVGAPPEPRAIALGVLNALRAVASRGPLLVAIDDVQWLDIPSADALAFAARRLDGDPVRFLLTRRSGTSSPVEAALERGSVTRIEFGALSAGAIRRIVYEQLGLVLPRRVLRRIVEAAAGNPLFALELGRTLVGKGRAELDGELAMPDGIENLLGIRVAALPEEVRRVVLAVALSAGVRTSQLASIADESALDAAVEAGVLTVSDDRVGASHPLFVAAAKQHARPAERRALHLELARVVTDEELRARHVALATDRPDAELARTVAAAAAASAARGAAHDAVDLAEHALRLTPDDSADRPERLLALAGFLNVAAEPQRAAELLVPELDRLPAGSPRARAHLLLADESRFVHAHVDECGLHLERALAESVGDPALSATVRARMSRHASVARVERIRDAEAWALEALPAARAAGPDVEREVLHGLGWARSLRGRPIDDLRERFAAVSGSAFEIFRSVDRIAAERYASRGEVKEARTVLMRLLGLAEERGEEWSEIRLRLGLCEVELRAGEWDEACRILDEWAESPARDLLTTPAYERCRACVALGRGYAAEAERWAGTAIAESEASGLRWDLLEALRIRGFAALLARDAARAADSLRLVWEHTRREGVDDPGAFPVAPDLVEALAELGEHDDAAAVTDRLRALAVEQAHPWGLASAQRCAGIVAVAARGDHAGATVQLEQAAADYGALGLRFDRARSLLILGRVERRARKWGAARRSLEAAATAFDELGSPGWADEARSELGRVGARRPAPSGELTPSERRVVELAASGLANKEIARTLFVGVHTVEVHLSHAYAKLGVRSRTQLAGRLAELA